MNETKAGRAGTSKPAKATEKSTSKAPTKTTGKPAVKSASKPAAKAVAKSATKPEAKTVPKVVAKKPRTIEERKPIQPISPAERRGFWVVFCLLMTFGLALAVFMPGGTLINALHRFILGLWGWGAYCLPFVTFIDMLLILIARGKPIKRQIITISILPFLISASVHILSNRVNYSENILGQLFEDGTRLVSGGFLAGGFAELMIKILSRVGTGILLFVLLTADILALLKVRFIEVADYLLDLIELWRISRGKFQKKTDSTEELFSEEYDSIESARESAKTKTPKEKKDETADDTEENHPLAGKALKKPVLSAKEESSEKSTVRRGKKNSSEFTDDIKDPRCWQDDLEKSEEKRPSLLKKAVQKKFSNKYPSDDDLIHWENTHSREEREEVSAPPIYYDTEQKMELFEEAEEEDLPPWEMPEKTFAEEQPVSEKRLAEKQENAKNTSQSTGFTVVDTHAQERPEERSAVPVEREESANGERPYQFPPVSLLNEAVNVPSEDVTEELRERSKTLADTLASFGVSAQITGVIRGPSVTRYELQLDRGVKLTRLTTLQNDIALALGATGVRIAPIPDKQAVGIEVPNKVVQIVYLREVLLSQNMTNEKSKLAFALGRDITGNAIVANIHKMPHLLIAGTTGSGKSVCINSIIVSLLYRTTPRDVRLIMIDPKMVELGNYNGIPHLLIPVVTDYKKAPGTLAWAVAEMERRYRLMAEAGARELSAYNEILAKNGEEPLPKIVIIIDELADLMMVAAKDIEEAICRIAQKARAAGMHLIIATQRPSADVLTGLMKSNIPSRIAFAVASQVESRIILDQTGADKLIGRGDMLFLPIGEGKPLRVQGCFLSDKEIERITDHIKANNQHEYSQEIIDEIENSGKEQGVDAADDEEGDPMLGDAIDIIMESGQASASMLQRRLKLGYARAGRMIDQLEARGIIGPYDGSRPRQILISKMDWQEMKLRYGVRS